MKHTLERRDLERLREQMRLRTVQLREEIRQTLIKSDTEHYLQIADQVRDLEDESFADLMVDVNLAEIDRDLEELRQIEAALARMREGSYGDCGECGQAIELGRLELTPFANRCFDCQSVYERTHYQKVGHSL